MFVLIRIIYLLIIEEKFIALIVKKKIYFVICITIMAHRNYDVVSVCVLLSR